MEDITLESVLRQYAINEINRLFTAMPAKVVGTPSMKEQRVDVQLLVDRVNTDDTARRHPIIQSVPLIFPGSRTSQFSFPVNEGDIVFCVFSQRSMDRFKMGVTDPHAPIDFRKYSRADAIAIPGLFPFLTAVNDPGKHSLDHSTDDAVLVHNIGTESECEVRLKAAGDITINAPGNKVEVNCESSVVNAASSSEVNTQTATINAQASTTINSPTTTVTGDMLVQGHLTFVSGMTGSGGGGSTATINGSLETTGDITAGSVSLQNHIHDGDSDGVTSPPK